MKSSKQISILVVDDHLLVREGITALISARRDMFVVGEASNGLEAIEKALSLRPDVILMDLVMPNLGGIEAIQEIKRHLPDSRILVLTSFADDKRVYQAVKSGALGYLMKDTSSKQLVEAIQQVKRGEPSLQPDLALKVIRELNRPTKLAPDLESLTEREVEVLHLLAQGLANQDISEQLCISERTVTKHVSHILEKLDLDNRTQAALYAIRKGIVDIDEEDSPG